MPTDMTWLSALVAIALGMLFALGWHLGTDLVAMVKARSGSFWDIIVIIIVIIVIIVVIVL